MQIDLKNCTFKLKDGSGRELSAKTGEGYLKWTEKKPRQYTKKLTRLHEVRNGDDEPMDVSFEFNWDFIVSNVAEAGTNPQTTPENGYFLISGPSAIYSTKRFYWDGGFGWFADEDGNNLSILSTSGHGGMGWSCQIYQLVYTPTGEITPTIATSDIHSYEDHDSETAIWLPTFTMTAGAEEYVVTWYPNTIPSIEDVLKRINGASSWTSTDSDQCRPYCIDLEIVHDPECSGVETETILIPKFRYESLDHDLRGLSISCKGKSLATEATVTRP